MRVDFAEALTEHGGRTLGVAAALFWRFAIKTMEPIDG